MNMIEVTDIEKRIAEKVDPTVAGAMGVSRHSGGLAFSNAAEAMEFSKMMAVSHVGVRKHLRGNVGACLAITIQSIEWGMSPFAVANKSYLVNDQIAYESQLIQAVILKRAPIKGRLKFIYSGEGDARRCKVVAKLLDDEIVDYESPEIGKIPVKNSPLWKNDPDQQLSYYSGRALCRRHFPDVLLGIYDIDELPDTSRDPERARDITAIPNTLAGRLDALAGDTSHDAETGEIVEHVATETAVVEDGEQRNQDSGARQPASETAASNSPDAAQAAGDAADVDSMTDASGAPAADPDPLSAIEIEGYSAARDGKSRKNAPLEYRKDAEKLSAYERGYDRWASEK